jgi:hypothetical protein
VKALNTPIGRNTINDIYCNYVGTGQLASSIVKGNILPSKGGGKGKGYDPSFFDLAPGLIPGTLKTATTFSTAITTTPLSKIT